MSYNKVEFKSMKEFKSVTELAGKYGYKTNEEFDNFIEIMVSNNLLKRG